MNEFQKAELKRKIGIGCIAAGVVLVVIAEKRRVDRLLEMSQSAVYDTMWSSFDEGVKYGIAVTKQLFEDQSNLKMSSMEDLYALGKPLNNGSPSR